MTAFKTYAETWDEYLLSVVMNIHNRIPDHTVFTNNDDELIIFAPEAEEMHTYSDPGTLSKDTRLLYQGPIENVDLIITGKHIIIDMGVKNEIMIRKVLDS